MYIKQYDSIAQFTTY